MNVIEINNLSVDYTTPEGSVHAVQDVSTGFEAGKITGIVGESGCGKSTLTESIVRILPPNSNISSGEILLNGEDVVQMSAKRLREIRWNQVAFIPQNAYGSLDPTVTIADQMMETIRENQSTDRAVAIDKIEEVLEVVDIDPARLEDYPHNYSGGMKQRVVLAMALLLDPDILIADEPTTGLDMLVKDKILGFLEKTNEELGITVVLVSHDIADIVETCDQLMVMYGGKLVEKGPSLDLFKQPTHPYTMGLKHSLPSVHKSDDELIKMEIGHPNLRSPPRGCRFVERCPFEKEECHDAHPPLTEARPGIDSACYRSDEWEELNRRTPTVEWAKR